MVSVWIAEIDRDTGRENPDSRIPMASLHEATEMLEYMQQRTGVRFVIVYRDDTVGAGTCPTCHRPW